MVRAPSGVCQNGRRSEIADPARHRAAGVGAFGSEGAGPGEFRDPAVVERGPDETVAVVDVELARLTLFEPSGAYNRIRQSPPHSPDTSSPEVGCSELIF